jgi:protein translocase SecG subunit
MQNVAHTLVILEAVIALLMIVSVLVQTPKASGLGGTIGGGDGGLGGGYRTRRGLERQIYWTSWVLVAAFLICSVANIWVANWLANHPGS